MSEKLIRLIEIIVNQVPHGCIFDSHFVITTLIKIPSDEYHRLGAAYLQTKKAHSEISKQIDKCDVERIKGHSWSDTIRGKPGKCACWRRL
jgi:hypothetical protein